MFMADDWVGKLSREREDQLRRICEAYSYDMEEMVKFLRKTNRSGGNVGAVKWR